MADGCIVTILEPRVASRTRRNLINVIGLLLSFWRRTSSDNARMHIEIMVAELIELLSHCNRDVALDEVADDGSSGDSDSSDGSSMAIDV